MKLSHCWLAAVLCGLTCKLLAAAGGHSVIPLDSGTSGPFLAMPDFVDNPAMTATNACSFSVALTDNDGIVVKDASGVNTILLTCQSAEYPGDTPGQWQDIGPYTNTEATLYYDHGVLPRSVTSVYPGITRAMICNGSELSALYYTGAVSAGSILPDNADKKSASIEFWIRPDGSVLNTQISTLYETGGGTGLGLIIDHGVLKGATAFNKALVKYDLNADALSVLPYEPTSEFFQVVMVTDLVNDINQLYINGVKVDEAAGNDITDWDGGDAAGVGRFQGTNHGGFIGNAAGTAYDTYYAGAIAAIRFYGAALSPAQIQQNFNAVTIPSASAGGSFEVAGIYTPGGALAGGTGTPVTLDSGGVVTLDSVAGNFTYDPAGIPDIARMWKGCYITDTFTCLVTNSGGYASDAKVTVAVYGVSQSGDADVAAKEGVLNTITASQLLAGDDLDHDDLDPFVAYYANPDLLSEPCNEAGVWINAGNGGALFDAATDTADIIPVVSGFGGIPYAVREPGAVARSPSFLAADDMTVELWFKPSFTSSGQEVLYEFGGGGTGGALVYNADLNRVEAYVDGGTDSNSDLQLFAAIGGVSWDEFNQVIAAVDIRNAGADSVTLYLNNDPSAPFSSAGAVTAVNPAGAITLMSGTDNSGIGQTAGTMALNLGVARFSGELAHVRVYAGILSAARMAKAYDSIRRPVTAVTAATSLPGAAAELSADGTVVYDATAMTTNIPYGAAAADVIGYQFTDAKGSTVSRTAPVVVTGAGTAIAVDDQITIGEDLTVTNFNPRLNDILSAGTILNNAIVVADYRDDFTAGTNVSQVGDFRDAGGHGWGYMWNAPTGWVDTLPYDGTSGELTDTSAYQFLVWDGNKWAVNDDNISTTGAPGDWVRLTSTGGHPGAGPLDSASASPVQRRPVAAYTVSEAGYYGIADSSLRKGSTQQNPIHVAVLVNGGFKLARIAPNATTIDFNCELGYLAAGDTIYVGIGPYLNRGSDGFSLDYSIVKLAGPDARVSGALGTLTTDGSSLTFTPNAAYEALAVGQSYTESLTYTVLDNGELTTATVTITITGQNDPPATVADAVTIDEDTVYTGGNVLANDEDVDRGDELTLLVSEVQGAPGNVGTPFITPLGATAVINADGSFAYDTTAITNMLNALSVSNTLYDTFSYLARDAHGLDAPAPATVTVTIEGLNDPVTAAPNDYVITPNRSVRGNLITEDTGSGADSDPDTDDILTIQSLNTNGVIGILRYMPHVSKLVGFRGRTTINGTTRTITYDPAGGAFANPVVFTSPASRNDLEPGSVKITGINPAGGSFDIEFKEQREDGAASDGDGSLHADENISWMVFEAGQYQLPDGTRFEVGKVSTDAYRQDGGAERWQTVDFTTPFSAQPVVVNQLQEWNDPFNELFGTRMYSANPHSYATGVKTNQFQVAMEDIEGDVNDSNGHFGTIGWLAIEAGSGTWDGNLYQAGVTPGSFTQAGTLFDFAVDFGSAPDIIACMATYAGTDPGNMRYDSLSGTQYKFYAAEDTHFDTETSHAPEWATFLAIGGTATEIYAIDIAPAHGFFTYDPAGRIDPARDGTVVESFTYTVTDGNGSSDTATVTITVKAPDGTLMILR
jgi:VCBS repeat-containing protein